MRVYVWCVYVFLSLYSISVCQNSAFEDTKATDNDSRRTLFNELSSSKHPIAQAETTFLSL